MAQSIKLNNDLYWDSSGIKEKYQTGSLTGSVSSGNAQFVSGSYTRYGNTISVFVNFKTTAAIAEGGTVNGSISGLPTDVVSLNRTIGWLGASAHIINVDPNNGSGTVFIRVIGSSTASGNTISGTMIGMCSSL